MLLHSLGTDHSIWDGVKAHMPAEVRVVAPDARGHGANPQGGVNYGVWTDDISAVIAELNDEFGEVDVHLVGLSMGGVQAMLYAAAHGESLASVVLANTFAYLEPEVQAARIDGITARVRERGMAVHGSAYVNETVMVGVDTPAARHMSETISAIPADVFLESVRATFSVDARELLSQITVPTLVVHAELDVKTPLPLSEYLRDNISGAKLVSVAGAGHLSAFDAPELFAAELSSFVNAVSAHHEEVSTTP